MMHLCVVTHGNWLDGHDTTVACLTLFSVTDSSHIHCMSGSDMLVLLLSQFTATQLLGCCELTEARSML